MNPPSRSDGILQGSDIAPLHVAGHIYRPISTSSSHKSPDPLSPVDPEGEALPFGETVPRQEHLGRERRLRANEMARRREDADNKNTEIQHPISDHRHGVRGKKPEPEGNITPSHGPESDSDGPAAWEARRRNRDPDFLLSQAIASLRTLIAQTQRWALQSDRAAMNAI